MAHIKFIIQAIRHPRTIGAVAPSSRALCNAMLTPIRFEQARVIVEFGAGTGSFTQELLKRMRPDATLLAFETNPTFCQTLKERIHDHRFILVSDSATRLKQHLAHHKLQRPSYIISGVPLASLPGEIGRSIVGAAQTNLVTEGSYIQFQYSLRSYKLLRQHFNQVTRNYVVMNVPPAVVYTCTAPRTATQ